jgi:hypothetical protein
MRIIGMTQLMPPEITFTGLSNFNDRVLFMNLVNDAHVDVFKQIASNFTVIFLNVLLFPFFYFIFAQRFVEKHSGQMEYRYPMVIAPSILISHCLN